MPYTPTIPPINQEDLRRWLEDELNRINEGVIDGQDYNGFKIHYAVPNKYEIGQIVFADGTSWDPGAGQGMYEYTNLGWAKLGGGNGNVVPTSHSALQDLLVDDHPQYHTDARGDARYYSQAVIDARVLNSLNDVTLGLTTDKDVLTYNGTTTQWEAASVTHFIDGGRADSVYTTPQFIDGGGA